MKCKSLYIGTSAKKTFRLCLGHNVSIGANSVVNKSFAEDNIMIAGMPAEKKKNVAAWYVGSEYEDRVRKTEELK